MIHLMKKVISALSIILSLLIFAPSRLAKELNSVSYEKTNPSDNYSYDIKRLKEKLSLTFFYRSPNKKVKFLKVLFDRRMAELKYVIDNKEASFLEDASQRYSATAGKITEVIIANNLQSEKEAIKNLFQEQITWLEQLQTAYIYDSAQWMFVKWDIDYLKLYIEKLST